MPNTVVRTFFSYVNSFWSGTLLSYRLPQKLEDKRLEPFRVAATLVEGNMAAVMEEVLPLEGLMDTPTLGASPLELQEDPMVV